MHRRHVLRCLALTGLALMGACSDDGDTSPTTAPLTLDQATDIATALSDNLADGGAVFQMSTPSDLPGGGTIQLSGVVDWEHHMGHALVVGAGSEANVVEVYWNEQAMLERRSDMGVLVAVAGPGVDYVLRPPDLNRRLDQLIGIIAGLAGTQPDNPLLVQQEAGSAYLRDDELRGVKVQVLRFGERSVFWLDADGNMLRFEGVNEAGNAPVIFDVLERGPQTITAPPEQSVVDVAQVADVWAAIVGAASQPATSG
ncbi:MAG TPA: hypothetical protein PLV13_01565 [Ilumatobacteraceae bacterium]|nr:hypothetical protein [Ilumatobacteraceae bacterium]